MHVRKTDGNKQIAPDYSNKTIQSNLLLNYVINIILQPETGGQEMHHRILR